MSNEHGGYRQPRNPAAASGPGALSKRTDGGAIDGMTQAPMRTPGTAYGEGGNMATQGAAPLAGNPYTPVAMTALNTPSFGDNMTDGIDFGSGPGSEMMAQMPMQSSKGLPSQSIRKMLANDSSGEVAMILKMLLDRGL